MHPYDIMVVISIACCVGYSFAIYERKDPILVLGYFVASAAGAFAGGYVALWALPELRTIAIIGGAFVVAIVLTLAWRAGRRKWVAERRLPLS